MGNFASRRRSDAVTVRVILSNGDVITFNKPLTVAELMLEHPQQVVVELQAVMHGKNPTPLPADRNLESKKLYLMLPVRKGKPAALSSEEARKLLARTNPFLKSTYAAAGFNLRWFGRVGGGKLEAEKVGEERMKLDFFAEALEGMPEYLNRQISGKGWKPSLDSIKEKTVRPKVRHWLF